MILEQFMPVVIQILTEMGDHDIEEVQEMFDEMGISLVRNQLQRTGKNYGSAIRGHR